MKAIHPQIFVSMLILIASCTPPAKTDDPEELKKVLSDYFDGLKTKDLNKMNAATTPDFILFEDGKIWNNDSLYIQLSSVNSFEGTWTFDYKRITIDQLSGDIVYLNHGDFTINDTISMKVDWVENATFRKIDGLWKMNLLHSTVRK